MNKQEAITPGGISFGMMAEMSIQSAKTAGGINFELCRRFFCIHLLKVIELKPIVLDTFLNKS
ncbi:hypothetical protein E2R58_08405 [Paenibacillus amylolyticus]|uniref:hypothetical protein n=1 Tax=Paenibacillus amylolyticus TaxID=1451 RepID=UPI0010599FE9|nr:hypothetical protein [Paenibacillus amylolyticus]TDL69196.1 hypothetical protein E2R58_08405 [Paenibacillus amylolyticus]